MNAIPKALDDDARAQFEIADAHEGLRADEGRGGHKRVKLQRPTSREEFPEQIRALRP